MDVTLAKTTDARPIDRYVAAHEGGSPFHETRWLELSRLTFGFATQTLLARRAGGIVGVLPLAMVTAPITGRRLVSVPFGVYGGILADDEEAMAALDEAACALATSTGARFLELRYRGAGPTEHESVALHETYRKTLPPTPDEVLGSIPRKRRAEVRRGRERHGLELVEGPHLFDDFYRLYVANKTLLGSPVFAPSYFRVLLELFHGRSALHGIVTEGRVVAAVLSVFDETTIYPYYSGEDGDARGMGVNNTMYCALMEDAVRRGFDVFDFGRSRVGSGAATFKRNMGFEPEPLDYQFFFPRGGRPPQINPSNPRTALPRRVLSTLPAWLAPVVGPPIMRHVP